MTIGIADSAAVAVVGSRRKEKFDMGTKRKSSTVRFGRSIAGVLVAGAVALAMVTNAPVANALEPGTVAAGAAAAGVVIKAIEGLSSWINDQSDDCFAAALGAAWGADCNLNKDEEQNTGWSTVYVSAVADNACAHGFGQGLAQESLFGSWAGSTVDPWVSAWTKPLHPATDEDFHKGRGWAKAGVDNHVKAKTEETPGDPQRTPAPGKVQSAWSPGDVVAEIQINSLDLKTINRRSGSSSTRWRIEAWIDGQRVFSSTGKMDHDGNVTVEGDMDAALFTPTYNAADDTWEISISDYTTDVFITHLDPGDPDAEVDVHVQLEAELESDDSAMIIPGDATGDCSVNILDMIFIRNKLRQDPSSGDNWRADVNNDGSINILDMILTRNHLGDKCETAPFTRGYAWDGAAEAHLPPEVGGGMQVVNMSGYSTWRFEPDGMPAVPDAATMFLEDLSGTVSPLDLLIDINGDEIPDPVNTGEIIFYVNDVDLEASGGVVDTRSGEYSSTIVVTPRAPVLEDMGINAFPEPVVIEEIGQFDEALSTFTADGFITVGAGPLAGAVGLFSKGGSETTTTKLTSNQYRVDVRASFTLLWLKNLDIPDGKVKVKAKVIVNGKEKTVEGELEIEDGESTTGLKIASIGQLVNKVVSVEVTYEE